MGVRHEEKSGLQIAKSKIINCNAWGVKEINERAKWLTEILLNDVMPIPIEMRRTNNYTMSQRRSLSFLEMQLIGKEIVFIPDMSYRATVVSDNRGTAYWAYDGIKLRDVI